MKRVHFRDASNQYSTRNISEFGGFISLTVTSGGRCTITKDQYIHSIARVTEAETSGCDLSFGLVWRLSCAKFCILVASLGVMRPTFIGVQVAEPLTLKRQRLSSRKRLGLDYWFVTLEVTINKVGEIVNDSREWSLAVWTSLD